MTLTPARATDRSLVSVAATYVMGTSRWAQDYVARPLDDADLSSDLERAGLLLDRRLSDDGRWVVAIPAS